MSVKWSWVSLPQRGEQLAVVTLYLYPPICAWESVPLGPLPLACSSCCPHLETKGQSLPTPSTSSTSACKGLSTWVQGSGQHPAARQKACLVGDSGLGENCQGFNLQEYLLRWARTLVSPPTQVLGLGSTLGAAAGGGRTGASLGQSGQPSHWSWEGWAGRDRKCLGSRPPPLSLSPIQLLPQEALVIPIWTEWPQERSGVS